MAEEEKNEQQEETSEADQRAGDSANRDAEQGSQAEDAQAEAPAEEDAPDEDAAPAAADEEGSPEAGDGGEDAASEEGEAESDGSGDQAVDDEDASPDLEGVDWKARRRLERSRRPAEPKPQRSPEERAASRGEARKQAARRRAAYRAKRRTKGQAGTGTPPAERRSAGRKTRQGRVVSSRSDKTITVEIDVVRRHPQYEKIVRRSRTLHAHDARNEAGEGDLVRVVETRPLSRTKRWRLVEVLEKAK